MDSVHGQGRGRQPPDGTPQRGPAAGRAQQEARAAASQAHSADLRALAEVRVELQVSSLSLWLHQNHGARRRLQWSDQRNELSLVAAAPFGIAVGCVHGLLSLM
jgi:hypothetical protein